MTPVMTGENPIRTACSLLSPLGRILCSPLGPAAGSDSLQSRDALFMRFSLIKLIGEGFVHVNDNGNS